MLHGKNASKDSAKTVTGFKKHTGFSSEIHFPTFFLSSTGT